MRRREFIALVGGSAGWSLVARAQQPTVPVIGFLRSTSAEEYTHVVAAFRQSLKQGKLIEGREGAIEFRWAGGQYNRLAPLADDLVRRKVAVIAVNNLLNWRRVTPCPPSFRGPISSKRVGS